VQREPDADWHIADLSHGDLYLAAYALGGLAHYQVAGSQFDVSHGDLVWFPPGCAHSAHSDPEMPWRFCSVGFDIRDRSSSTEALALIPPRIRLPNHYRIGALFEELAHEWSGKRLAYLVRCRSLVEEIIFSLVRAVDEEEQRRSVPHVFTIQKVARLIEQHPELTFSVGQLADRAKLSESYFRRLFRLVTGYTPVQYQQRIKINKAKDLLLSGECNVSEAAYQLGFDSIYYFSRLFKRVTSVNPSDYLKR
jgi:AraC-like DNA-binding protein